MNVISILALSVAIQTGNNPTKTDGAYVSAQGGHYSVRFRDDGKLRIIDLKSGEWLVLEKDGEHEFKHPSKSARAKFEGDTLTIRQSEGETRLDRFSMREIPASFKSGDITLNGKLYLPPTATGPVPVMVMVHGSDATGSVDQDELPDLLVPKGVGCFIYDKRGTGASEGTYTQLFQTLAKDVIAAIDWLAARPEVDPGNLGLIGYSQGGWVAPLAASMDKRVGKLLVCYGMAMTIADEDRLEAPLKLKAKGFEGRAITEFQELNGAIHKWAETRFTTGWEEVARLEKKYRERDWFKVMVGSETWAGSIFGMGLDEARRQLPKLLDTYFDPYYDPFPALRKLNIPVSWLIAGEDIEAPPKITLDVLKKLRSEGRPVSMKIFPGADHGMRLFEQGPNGRRYSRYADGFFDTIAQWALEGKI